LAWTLRVEIDIYAGDFEGMRFKGSADHNFSNGWTGPVIEDK